MDPAALLQEARAALEETRQLLLEPTPTRLDLCASHVNQATAKAHALHQALSNSPTADAAVKASAAQLRLEVLVIASLLDRAAAFHAGLFERMLAAQSAPPETAPVMARRVLLDC